MTESASAIFEELETELTSSANAESKSAETVVEDKATDAAPAADAKSETIQLADPKLAEAYQSLVDRGITPENADLLLEKANTADKLGYFLKHAPKELMNLLEKDDPGVATKVANDVSDWFLERNPADEKAKNPLENELKSLRTTVDKLIERDRNKEVEATRQRVGTQFQESLNSYLNNDKIKESLTTWERKGLEARVRLAVGNDPNAVAQINKGNFVPVGKYFKTELENLVAEKKAANADEHKSRQTVAANSGIGDEVSTGGDSKLAGVQKNPADSWDDTENHFAAILNKSRRK